jgi:hypothetical protein
VSEVVIQRILRHANVSTTATYYIKTAAEDVRNAMAKLENVELRKASKTKLRLIPVLGQIINSLGDLSESSDETARRGVQLSAA